VSAVSALPFDVCVLDGEALAYDEQGWPRFHSLRSAVHRGRAVFPTQLRVKLGNKNETSSF
jgi:ATP-dependent DNA ligase